MGLARHGNLHSLHHEVLQPLGEMRTIQGHKDRFLPDRKVLMKIGTVAVTSEVTVRVLQIEKASCPIRLAVMNLQRLGETTSLNGISQMSLQIYLPESHLHQWIMLTQIL